MTNMLAGFTLRDFIHKGKCLCHPTGVW